MSLIKTAIIVVLTAFIVGRLPHWLREQRPIRIEGFVAPGFENVKETFYRLFVNGFERVGANFAAYHKGELVVDLRGGYADESILRPWTEDTWSVMWSSTKAITALALAWVVDRGYVTYDTSLVKFWPEYGKHGKANTTVEWMVNHKSGVIITEASLNMDTMRDWKKLGDLIADTKPFWPPGEHSGYSPVLHGNLIDQIIRRTDPKKRSLSELVREEFIQPNNLNLSIGLPKTEFHRMTRLFPTPTSEKLYTMFTDPIMRGQMASMIWTALRGGRILWNEALEPMTEMLDPDFGFAPNVPEWLTLDMGATSGVGTAKSVAKLFSLLGEGKILSPKTMEMISKPTWFEKDLVIGLNISKGYGLFHFPNSKGDNLMGHPGYGGQNLWLDPKKRLSMVYLTNAYKLGLGYGIPSYAKLQDAVYDSIH